MRWEGWVAISVGTSLYLFGLLSGHQEALDAVLSGVVMVAGTGAYVMLRHRAPFRAPGEWFTSAPLLEAEPELDACSRGRLLARLLAETEASMVFVVGLSFLTGFWLTYMDFAVWAVTVGVIKIGPAGRVITTHETRNGKTYRVARRPLRGLVALTEERTN